MKIEVTITIELVIITALIQTIAHADFLVTCMLSQSKRIDPIVSFGKPSGHYHDLAPGVAINMTSTTTTTDLMSKTCELCNKKGDRSAYWFPSMFFRHSNGTVVKLGGVGADKGKDDRLHIYYLFMNQEDEIIQKPPQGLGIVAGNAKATENELKGKHPALLSMFIEVSTVGDKSSDDDENENPSQNSRLRFAGGLPEQPIENAIGIKAEIYFPNCMKDPSSFVLSDFQDHTQFMKFSGHGRKCPSDYPYRIPLLRMVKQWTFPEPVSWSSPEEAPIRIGDPSLSNGTWGNLYQYHADALFNWDQAAIDQLFINCSTTSPGNCQSAPVSNGRAGIDRCLRTVDQSSFKGNTWAPVYLDENGKFEREVSAA